MESNSNPTREWQNTGAVFTLEQMEQLLKGSRILLASIRQI